MRLILPLTAALVLGTTSLLAGHRDNSNDDRASGLYERIVAHYGSAGRTVKERFRDGPCKIKREWKTNGDYEESIKCRGPRNR